jgi:N-acetylglucosaminyldiphosphoundecaprenol N-acetyl-beta-D-mannosaminyltransferase
MSEQRIDFLGLPLDPGLTAEEICGLLSRKGETHLIAYVTPSSWAVARRHPDYLKALQQIPTIHAASNSVAYICRWLTGNACIRVSFDTASLADPLFRAAVTQKASVMLVGGQPSVDEQMAEKLKAAYSQLNIIGSLHGFGDLAPKAVTVATKAPDLVVIGMGSPRQELFLLALREAGYKGMAITCGEFFEQFLLDADYYPAWVEKLNLRALWQFYKEPQRLWRRYFIDYPLFAWEAVKAFWYKYFPQAKALAEENISKAKDAFSKLRRN